MEGSEQGQLGGFLERLGSGTDQIVLVSQSGSGKRFWSFGALRREPVWVGILDDFSRGEGYKN